MPPSRDTVSGHRAHPLQCTPILSAPCHVHIEHATEKFTSSLIPDDIRNHTAVNGPLQSQPIDSMFASLGISEKPKAPLKRQRMCSINRPSRAVGWNLHGVPGLFDGRCHERYFLRRRKAYYRNPLLYGLRHPSLEMLRPRCGCEGLCGTRLAISWDAIHSVSFSRWRSSSFSGSLTPQRIGELLLRVLEIIPIYGEAATAAGVQHLCSAVPTPAVEVLASTFEIPQLMATLEQRAEAYSQFEEGSAEGLVRRYKHLVLVLQSNRHSDRSVLRRAYARSIEPSSAQILRVWPEFSTSHVR